MKTLAEIADIVMRTPSGGMITDENKLDTDFIYGLVDNGRATEIKLDYKQNRNIHPAWLQTYIPPFDSYIQGSGDCLVSFECPAVIHVGERDGFEFVGTYFDTTNKASLRKIKSIPSLGTKGMAAVYSQHRMTQNETAYLWRNDTGGFTVIEIYGNKSVKNLGVEGIFASPSKLAGYRPDKDMYPVTEEMLSIILFKLFKEQTQPMYARPADIVSNNQDNANLGR